MSNQRFGTYMRYLIILLFFIGCKTGKNNDVNNDSTFADTVTHAIDSSVSIRTFEAANFRLAPSLQNSKTYGVWGNGGVSQRAIGTLKDSLRKYGADLLGWNIRIGWGDIQQVAGVYNWKVLDDMIRLCIQNNIKVGFMIYVGDNSPMFIYQTPYSVERVTTDRGIYPYYLNETYKNLAWQLWRDIAAHIALYPDTWKANLLFQMSAEGSTGDVGNIKGTIQTVSLNGVVQKNPETYNISNLIWTGYRHQVWDSLYKYNAGNTFLKILVNPGNGGQDYDWAVQHLKNVWLKSGNSGHQFLVKDEIDQILRNQKFTLNNDDHRIRTEFEGTDRVDTSFNKAVMQTIVFNALLGNVDIFCVAEDKAVYGEALARFNKYAGQRSAQNTTRGFSYAANEIDYNDTLKFPQNVYGKINTAARETLITNTMLLQGASNKDGLYWNDFGTNVWRGNMERFLHLVSANFPLYRVNSTDGYWGRWAISTKNQLPLVYDIDSSLQLPDTTKISVTYLDRGSAKWSIKYSKGGNIFIAPTIKNNASGKWMTAEFKIANMDRRGVYNHAFFVAPLFRNIIVNLVEIE